MREPRKIQRSVIGVGIVAIAVALCCVAIAADLSADTKTNAVDAAQYADFMENEALDIQDLAEGAEIQRRCFNILTPPGVSLLQPMLPLLVPFEAANFADSFLDELLGADKNSVAIYPLSLALDPKTRETLIYNADGKLIATVTADKNFRNWSKDADPARVTLRLDLLPSEDVEPYLYVEGRIAESSSATAAKTISSEEGGFTLKSLGADQFGFTNILKSTNGNMRLTVTNGTDMAELYAYTVVHTSSVVVANWVDQNGVTNIGTNILWTPVSPPFNGIESEWECLATNLLFTDNAAVWEDANISSNARIRFYATAKRVDTDGDSLSDGSEIFLHRTDPGMADTDGDGMPDGWEVQYGLNALSGLEDSLAGWWKLDDGEGTNAINSAMDGYHGELLAFSGSTNGGWVENGVLGGALRFDGMDDRVRVVQSPAILTGGPFTVSAWACLDAGCTSDYPEIISDLALLPSFSYAGYCMGFTASSNAFGMVGDDMQTDMNTATGQWVWVALEYDGTQMRLYRDGMPVGMAIPASFMIASNSAFAIGDGQDPYYTEQWKGMIDDVRLYRAALGTNGIATMYDALGDLDGDGLTNVREYQTGARPHIPDTDEDGLTDGDEVNLYGTNPNLTDTDGDTIPDGAEIDMGLDPLDAADAEEDPDSDHLVNREEYELGLAIDESNEVTMVYYNPDPPVANRFMGTATSVLYVTRNNLQAKALSTIRYKEGYPEFTDDTLPPSEPPKWYLSREWAYQGEGDGMGADGELLIHCTHSEYQYCLKEFDPIGWPSTPSNHLCTGDGQYFRSREGECLYTAYQWGYYYDQPSTNIPFTQELFQHHPCVPSSYSSSVIDYFESCSIGCPLSPEVNSHTEAYVSNNWNVLLEWELVVDPDAYEWAFESLTNEYTDDMLRFHTEADLCLMPSVDNLVWGQRYARDDHRQEPYVEALPTNEIHCAYLLSTNHDKLQLQDLYYQWTVFTTTGTVYKFMWLEAFRPQNSETYAWYKGTSTVFKGTGGMYTSRTYKASRPLDMTLPMEYYEPYGTVTPIGFLVELECSLAETTNMGFGIDPPDTPCYAVWDEEAEAAKSDQNKINSALTVFFKNASTPEGDPTHFNVTLRVYPEDLPGVLWEKTEGPNSGSISNASQPVATFVNPTKGGRYIFSTTIPGVQPIYSQLWLPVSGPDISVDFQREIDYLKTWIVDYNAYQTTRALAELPIVDHNIPEKIEGRKRELWWGDLEKIGLDFDYETPISRLNDICGLANVFNANTNNDSAGDAFRFVINGATRPYVTDFAKRNNMGFAMFAYYMGVHPLMINYGPDAYLAIKGGKVGTKDDKYARAAYAAGISIAQGLLPASAIQDHALEMQHPDARVSKEWPGDGVAETNCIYLHEETMKLLKIAAGK